MQSELQVAFDSRCFDQQSKFPQTYFDDEKMALSRSAIDTVYNSSLTSWLSSPIAMAHSIEQNLATSSGLGGDEDPVQLSLSLWSQQFDGSASGLDQKFITIDEQEISYNTPMHMVLEERSNRLTPILAKIKDGEYEDNKVNELRTILEEHCLRQHGKTIVFVKRYFTAQYLYNCLIKIFKNRLSIGCTVVIDDTNPRLKDAIQRSTILKQFSPRSHHYKASKEYDVLICTDADGVGVNLQDADTVVNYDPPEGADELFQRAGRVIRMTKDPERVIHLYTFKPSILSQARNSSRVQSSICERFNRLNSRHSKSKDILGAGVMSEKTIEVTLEGDLDIEKLTHDNSFLRAVGGLGAESGFTHMSVLEQFRDRAETLPSFLLSAKSYSEPQSRIFVLVQYLDKSYPILFNLVDESIESQDELTILDLIACTALEPRAAIQAADIERSANQAVQCWCETERVAIEQVSKICALYLAPANEATQIGQLFR